MLSLILWMYGGARAGLYQDLYVIEKFDEIMEVTYPEEVEAFLPGIETLALGFAAFVGLLALSAFMERKSASD